MNYDALIRVKFYTPQQNGRKSAVQGRTFGCPMLIDGQAFDCRLFPPNERMELGVSYSVPVKFLSRDAALRKLKVGKEVLLWEGKEIASASVLELM